MTTDNSSSVPNRGGFGRALASIGRFLFRLVLVLLIGAILGGLIFFGITSLYTRFIQPQQVLNDRVTNLETRQVSNLAAIDTKVTEITGRIYYLESTYPEKLENLSALEGDVKNLQAAQAASNVTLQQIETLQAELQKMEDITLYNATQVAGLTAERYGTNAPLASLGRDLQVIKALEMLNRARLYMVDSNYGLAEDDVQAARNVIARMQQDAPPYQQDTLSDWMQRLDRLMEDLPGSPVAGADNLEQTWELLAAGLPTQPVDESGNPLATSVAETVTSKLATGTPLPTEPPVTATPKP